MTTDQITIAEAADMLALDRSNVLKRARRGDFGQIIELGTTGSRPSMLLLDRESVEEFAHKRATEARCETCGRPL